jgi:hypothetical protein
MEKNISDDQQELLSTSSDWGLGGARRVAQQAQVYYHNINQDTRSETQAFFTIIGALLGLTSGLVSFASGMRANTHPPERRRLQISIRNLTRFTLVIIDTHGSNSRVSPSPTIMPGETVDYLYAVGNSLPNNGHDMLTLALVPVNEQRQTMNIRIAITDNNSYVQVSRVTFNNETPMNDPIPNQPPQNITNVFYGANLGNTNVWVVPSTLTNGGEGKLDLAILSSS